MARLSRAEAQERTRGRVLAAACAEFTERGYRAARIDDIAARAELTRGAVYSNFPGKRALYFAVLADLAERATAPAHARPGRTRRAALGAFARSWVTRLPYPDPDVDHGPERLALGLGAEISTDERLRRPFRQLLKLDALLLALALEQLAPPTAAAPVPVPRLVRLAETVLTTLHGAGHLAATAPGFVEPFDVVSACEHLADLALNDWWSPPPGGTTNGPTDDPWAPPAATDPVRAEPVPLRADGVVVLLGLDRLGAAEDAVRAAPAGTPVSMVLVTGAPDELTHLARLVLIEFGHHLRQAFPGPAWPRLRVVCDASGDIAAAAGVPPHDTTEVALRIDRGRIVRRADGPGAGYALVRSGQPAGSPR
ncbi:TetR family transcriptional regulator [Micromonospora echinofusca]|uniref:TetR family transcriptional regulator n=2 Tax=Micromonospora echinofusca TaxID=47858 RepID=A0ABS3VPU4_MICEH|nr:TetR family transcriptional regulator [Micromonospora echinofusca]